MSNRRTIASSLLLAVALPLLVLLFLQAKQTYIRHSLEERLEKGLEQTLFVSKQDWKPHNSHEIWVAEKLFDLKEVTPTDDGFIVTGVFDEDETAVLQHLEKTCAGQTSKDTPVFAQFFHLLQGFFFQEAGPAAFVAHSQAEVFQNPIPHLPFSYSEVLAPPPQVVS